ncbi:MAG TPA: STAS domain-containing protein [Solirubrobacteraceae bacterium]|jgi:MFS superfamily sulfate permease-like transporter|nr:STAS domain-containing protein [Solirubrobacteraceae bacterium]
MNATHDGSASLEIFSRAWPALQRAHLTVRGPLSSATRAELVRVVGLAIEPGHEITLDLSEITTADADGAQAVRDCEALAERRSAVVVVQDPSPAARRALRA